MRRSTLEVDAEQAAVDLFVSMGWETANVYDETFGDRGTLGRETRGDVVLLRRLRAALVEQLTRDRSAMPPAHANRDVYGLLKNGVKVKLAASSADELCLPRL